ncbi:MAG: hypothetical protein JXR38_03305 [Bacilli bacterium]|nr:hypothetical protein [Bacilli bacterium]
MIIIEMIEVIGLTSIAIKIKKNAYLILSVMLLGLSLGFAIGTVAVMGLSNDTDATRVGSVFLGQYDSDQYATVLNREVTKWKNSIDYELVYQDYQYAIDSDLFVFDVASTIAQINLDQDNDAIVSLSTDEWESLAANLESILPETVFTQLDLDELSFDILDGAKNLEIRSHFEIESYLDAEVEGTILATAMIDGLSTIDIQAITAIASQITIEGTSRFSLLEIFAESSLTNNQLSVIASGILSVTKDTNFDGYVFSQNYEMPSWAKPGSNVMILKVNNYDFSFFNDLDQEFILELAAIGNDGLLFTLKGLPFINDYATTAHNVATIPHSTIYNDDPTIDELTPGVIVTETDTEYVYHLLVETGVDGRIDAYVRITTDSEGETYSQTLYYDEIYPVTEIYRENIVLKAGD